MCAYHTSLAKTSGSISGIHITNRLKKTTHGQFPSQRNLLLPSLGYIIWGGSRLTSH